MQILSMLISIYFLTILVHTSPLDPDVAPRSVLNSTNGAINATVFDHAGHDISSSFQIRLFNTDTLGDEIANNNLSSRQVAISRQLNKCPRLAEFRESFCTPEDSKAGSLQRYTVVCQQFFAIIDRVETPIQNNHAIMYAALIGASPITRIETSRRDGHCDEDEICVDGLGIEASKSGRRMASCVRNEYFIKYISWGHKQPQNLDLEGKIASMVVSQEDGTTPIEVDTLELDTETTGVVQTKRCRDCVGLKTDPFGAETSNLRFQARLLTAGTMAGVLWLAIASG